MTIPSWFHRGLAEKSQLRDGRGSASSSESSNLSQQQPRKMTFMEQVNKRKGNRVHTSITSKVLFNL